MKNTEITLLPLSSVISSFLLGYLAQHLLLRSFFNSFTIPVQNKYPYFLLTILLVVLADQFISGLKYTPVILLFFGVLLVVHFYLFNRKKMFAFVHLLKVAN